MQGRETALPAATPVLSAQLPCQAPLSLPSPAHDPHCGPRGSAQSPRNLELQAFPGKPRRPRPRPSRPLVIGQAPHGHAPSLTATPPRGPALGSAQARWRARVLPSGCRLGVVGWGPRGRVWLLRVPRLVACFCVLRQDLTNLQFAEDHVWELDRDSHPGLPRWGLGDFGEIREQ